MIDLTLEIEDRKAIELLECGVSPTHTSELSTRIEYILEDFRREQALGISTLRANLRAWTQSHIETKDIQDTIDLAERIRNTFKVFILVGIGGSDLGGRTLHDALDHPFHNQMHGSDVPEIYFTGDTFDPRRLKGLLDLLRKSGKLKHTCVNVVSKSGKTGETIAAAMVIRAALEKVGVTNWQYHFVATTGQNDESILYLMNEATPFFGMLPVPVGVGGRFSFASPVGLLPFAVTAQGQTPEARVKEALTGYAEAHERFALSHDDPKNVASRLAQWLHLGDKFAGRGDLIFCNYADDARLGDWFVQLYSESVQKRSGGLSVMAMRGPTGNHSILNGILSGPNDKLLLMVRWKDLGDATRIPTDTQIVGDLEAFEGLKLADVQDASCLATADEYLENRVSTVTITVGRRDAAHLFLLMRTLMDAVAIKGRLQGLNMTIDGHPDPTKDLTYRQDGVEGYKIRTRKRAEEMQKALLEGTS